MRVCHAQGLSTGPQQMGSRSQPRILTTTMGHQRTLATGQGRNSCTRRERDCSLEADEDFDTTDGALAEDTDGGQ